MWRYTTKLLLIALGIALVLADTDCTILLESEKITSWSTGSITFSTWNVLLIPVSVDILALELSLTPHENITQVLNLSPGRIGSGLYKVPIDKLSTGSAQLVSYTVLGTKAVNVSVSSVMCTFKKPSTPTKPPIPPPPSHEKVCDVVLVIDNFIVRTSPDLDSVRHKYTSYFTDVDLFYQKHFNTKMNLVHMHLEDGPTFSGTNSEGELLDSFHSALMGGFFGPDMPSSACTYHLVTGRDPPGIGGFSWIDTLCDEGYYNTGFSVDVQAHEEPANVIKRMIHEIGHVFGGQHFDYYQLNPLYNCVADNSRELRSLSDNGYKYLHNDLLFSECAKDTIVNSIPSYECLWKKAKAASAVLPFVSLYEGRDFSGANTVVPAHHGMDPNTCYNIVYPYGSWASAFILNGVSGIRFFSLRDCIGQRFEFNSTSPYVGDLVDDKANSFQFIR